MRVIERENVILYFWLDYSQLLIWDPRDRGCRGIVDDGGDEFLCIKQMMSRK